MTTARELAEAAIKIAESLAPTAIKAYEHYHIPGASVHEVTLTMSDGTIKSYTLIEVPPEGGDFFEVSPK